MVMISKLILGIPGDLSMGVGFPGDKRNLGKGSPLWSGTIFVNPQPSTCHK